MRQTLTRSEFNGWVSYYKFKEPDETEIQLAVLSLMVSAGLGNKKAKLDDFLLNKPNKQASETVKNGDAPKGFESAMDMSAVQAAFSGIAVRKG